jgi:hypothetical protein
MPGGGKKGNPQPLTVIIILTVHMIMPCEYSERMTWVGLIGCMRKIRQG